MRIARDGEEVLACLRPHEPPIFVLLDLKLPFVSGLEILRHMRSQDGLAQIPVVVFTSSDEPNDRTRCLEAGANEFLTKPMEFQAYLDIVAQTTQRYLSP